MNITNDTLPTKPRWRAKENEVYCYITINPFGVFRITKSVDRRKQVDEELWVSGNYFMVEEAPKFAKLIKEIFKNRI